MSDKGRTPERQLLASAIAARDAAASREAQLAQALERAKADRFKASRTVEEAESTLNRVRAAARESLVDAYTFMSDDRGDDGVEAAEQALALATRRLAELQMVEAELGTRTGPAPGHTLPSIKVEAALRDVVRSHPTVRRMVKDFETARRTFQQYEATLIHLAGQACIPDDLTEAAPKANHTRYASPDPVWLAAMEQLKRDPDAPLPE